MKEYPPIKILESELVFPSEETPTDNIWLSNLDLLVARDYTPTVYFYRRPQNAAKFFSPEILKSSLSRALIPFYPLAGRLITAVDGRPYIQCNNKGALFIVARSESSLQDFGDFAPSDQIRRLLVPFPDSEDKPLVMFQLTFFICGALCLGAAVHHSAADGLAALHFINSWAGIARTNSGVSVSPFLDRKLLLARSPPLSTFSHIEYSQSSSSAHPRFTSAILRLSDQDISFLKTIPSNSPISTFKAVVSHVWRSACKARGLDLTSHTRLYMTADARSRMRPPLPVGYLGNAIFRTSVEATAGQVIEFRAAEKIQAVMKQIDDGYVRSLVDYLEGKVGDSGVRKGGWVMPETDLWVISWMGLPIYDADFGWGKPVYMGRASLQFGGLVYIVPSSLGVDGGVSVVVAMAEEIMEEFKKVFYEDIGRIGSTNL